MIIERKKIKPNDVVVFKTTSGEEVIGTLVDFNIESGVTKISKPIMVAMQMVGPQQAQIGFAPFMAACEDNVTLTFPPSSYLFEPVLARDDVAKGYRNATSSIALPTGKESSIILG